MMESLPADELCKSIKDVMQLLRDSFEHQTDQNKPKSEWKRSSSTRVLDRLTKFSEASLKRYEELKHNYETARDAYKTVGSNAHFV